MPDPYRQVRPGERVMISAQIWNRILALAAAADDAAVGANGLAFPRRDPDVILVQNNSGSDRARGDVLGVDSFLYTQANDDAGFWAKPVFVCSTPAAGHSGRFVVLLAPAAAGAIARAAVAGTVQCKVVGGAAAFADVDAGNATRLVRSATGSARVLLPAPGGTGDEWAIVRLGDGAGGGGGPTGSGTAQRLAVWAGSSGTSTVLTTSQVQDFGSSAQIVKVLTRLQYSVITRSGVSGTLNDYDPWTPSGYGNVLVFNTGNAVTLNGLVGGLAGMPLYVISSGGGTLTINHQNVGSALGNRFNLPGGAIVDASTGRPYHFLYDGSAWQMAKVA
jgi:hypothetical protein